MATKFIHNGQQYMITDDWQFGYRVHKETREGPRLGAPVYIEDTDLAKRAYAELQRELDDGYEDFMAELDAAEDWDIQLQRVYPGAL